jgi:thiol:disulfide interchange protein DsbC
MREFLFLFVVSLFVLQGTYSYGFSSKSQDCAKCHSLKKDEAATLLKKLDDKIKVLSVAMSPAKYLWEVTVESNGKKGLVYIDLPKKHLISGTVIELKGKRNLTEERLSEINKINVSQIPLKDALVLGDRNAKKRVIVFDDPE